MTRLDRARCLVSLVFLLLALLARWTALSGERLHARSDGLPPHGIALIARPQEPGAPAASDAPARISADAGTPAEASDDLFTVCRVSHPAAGTSQQEFWASLHGPRIAAESSAETLPVYAVRNPGGAQLLVVNQSDAKAAFQVQMRLTPGVYTVERIALNMQPAETLPQVERLESVILGRPGAIRKPGWLFPHAAAIYRFCNRGAQTQTEFQGALHEARVLAASRPQEYRRLMTPLRECQAHVAALSYGIDPPRRYQSLKHVHRALLTVAHAQSLCRNFGNEGRLPPDRAAVLKEALDRLETALTELSAACLNLAPAFSLAPPDPARPGVWEVTVCLANAGQQTVTNVKLGVTAPEGATVRPAEQALFRSVRPGETARAAFTVRMEPEAAARDFTAEVAYFTARAPAHLRFRPFAL